jgi:hypothetical protein
LKGLARFFKMPNEVMKQIFADEAKCLRQNRKHTPPKSAVLQFTRACKEALADGVLTPEEEAQLKSLAEFLKIPKHTMKRLFAHEAKLHQKSHAQKPTT